MGDGQARLSGAGLMEQEEINHIVAAALTALVIPKEAKSSLSEFLSSVRRSQHGQD